MAALAGTVVERSDDELRSLLRLRLLPGLSGSGLTELLRSGHAPEELLARPRYRLPREAADALQAGVGAEEAEQALRHVRAAGLQVFTEDDPGYPRRLRELDVPPPLLFAKGRLELLERPTLSIVGTRAATTDGMDFAKLVAERVVAAGGVVISGLALGIDGAAHRGALPDTVAVLGCGHDRRYPPRHRALQDRIGAEGLLLSEFPPGTAPLPHNFPRRNRMIAALCKVLLVVEAPEKSGALITADDAERVGREIMWAPGSPMRRASRGSNARLRQGGGHVAADPADVLRQLGLRAEPPVEEHAGPPAGAAARVVMVWHALSDEPRHIDEIALRVGLSAPIVLAALLELELDGQARRLDAQRYQRT